MKTALLNVIWCLLYRILWKNGGWMKPDKDKIKSLMEGDNLYAGKETNIAERNGLDAQKENKSNNNPFKRCRISHLCCFGRWRRKQRRNAI